jgi:uncharacterized caspase-like protein
MWIQRYFFSLFAMLTLLATPALANTESRLALLIGNASYKTSPLSNPVNDVRLMETALKEAGFTVVKAENASIRDMRRLVRDFGDRLKASGGVGLFYFAGHGVQVRGENFLVSTDSDIRNEDEVADDALNANVILEKMQTAGNRMNLIILDACRNNPFAVKSRSAASGLATMSAPSGSLVAYSTAPGSVASDGVGKNGLYTEHLAKVLRQPGLPVEEVFKQVRAAVRKDSNNTQTPWENTALEGQFFFKAPVQVAAPAPAPAPAAKPAGPDPTVLELAMWDSIKAANTAGELQTYINRYPNGIFTDVAKARIAALSSVASERAASEKAANERAANERAAAEASLKAISERALADKAAAERAQSSAASTPVKTTDPLALDMAFWENVKSSQRSSELQAYLAQFPQGTFAMLAKARIEEIKNPSVSKPTEIVKVSPKVLDGVIGTMVVTDVLTGIKSDVSVTVKEEDGKVTYSTGDSIDKNGSVIQVKIGSVQMRVVSGSLWSFPIKEGTSGEARMHIGSVNSQSPGSISWKVVAAGSNKFRVEATVGYTIPGGVPPIQMYGKWFAVYQPQQHLPESFSATINGPYHNRDFVSAIYKTQ